MIGAFFIGLFGSVHCLGMCGPLMITFTRPVGSKSVGAFILYHLGRLITYSLIGVLFGVLSMSLFFVNAQKIGAVFFGVLIIILYGFPKLRNGLEGTYYHSGFYRSIKENLTHLYRGKLKWLAAGVLNGLLPCGMIYLAAAGAVLAGSLQNAVGFMMLFGLGTLPMLFGLWFLSYRFSGFSKKLSNLTTPVALISGLLLILRGVFIESPDLNQLMQMQIAKLMTICGF